MLVCVQLPSDVRGIEVKKLLKLQGLGIWCDIPPKGAASTAAAAAAATEPVAGKQAASMPTATEHAAPKHEYILAPIDTSVDLALSDDFDLSTELLVKTLWPLLLLHVRPEQLQSMLAILASLLRHTAATQRALEAVAARHFRPATKEERDRYISLYKHQSVGHKLGRGSQDFMSQVEREVSFADLMVMRGVAAMEFQVSTARKRHEQLIAATHGEELEPLEEEAEPTPTPTEKKEPGFFDWLSQSMGISSAEPEPQQQPSASSASSKQPASSGQQLPRPGAQHEQYTISSSARVPLTSKSEGPTPPRPLEHAAKATEHKVGQPTSQQQQEAKFKPHLH